MKILFCIVIMLSIATPSAALDQKLAGQVLAEMNLARTKPNVYAGFIRELRGRFHGKTYSLPGSTIRVQTSEGISAVDEAIRFLSRQPPLKPLTWSKGLAAAAAELATEQEGSGATGHGKQSRGLQERIERHGTWRGQIGENIGYGPKEPRDMVMQLIIDDGVPNRGHRKNIFNPAFNTAGIAWGLHPRFGNMCVIDFAGGFSE